MTDPDGVTGEATRIVTVRTRAEPIPREDGRVLHVYPHGFEGTKLEPPFEGLICAYNSSCGGGDFATARRPRVRAGTPSSYTPVSTATATSSTAEPTARSRSRAPTT